MSPQATDPPPSPSLLRRGAVGFWFVGVGTLGLVRGLMRAMRDGAMFDGLLQADAITWTWLLGSALVLVVGAAVVARAAFKAPR